MRISFEAEFYGLVGYHSINQVLLSSPPLLLNGQTFWDHLLCEELDEKIDSTHACTLNIKATAI